MYHAVTATATAAKSIKKAQVGLPTQSQKNDRSLHICGLGSHLLTQCTWTRPERWELGRPHLKQKEKWSIHQIPGGDGGVGWLFLFIICRWNLATIPPTPSVSGRWGIWLWVESTSFLPKKRAVLSSSEYFWRRRASKTSRNSGINKG